MLSGSGRGDLFAVVQGTTLQHSLGSRPGLFFLFVVMPDNALRPYLTRSIFESDQPDSVWRQLVRVREISKLLQLDQKIQVTVQEPQDSPRRTSSFQPLGSGYGMACLSRGSLGRYSSQLVCRPVGSSGSLTERPTSQVMCNFCANCEEEEHRMVCPAS